MTRSPDITTPLSKPSLEESNAASKPSDISLRLSSSGDITPTQASQIMNSIKLAMAKIPKLTFRDAPYVLVNRVKRMTIFKFYPWLNLTDQPENKRYCQIYFTDQIVAKLYRWHDGPERYKIGMLLDVITQLSTLMQKKFIDPPNCRFPRRQQKEPPMKCVDRIIDRYLDVHSFEADEHNPTLVAIVCDRIYQALLPEFSDALSRQPNPKNFLDVAKECSTLQELRMNLRFLKQLHYNKRKNGLKNKTIAEGIK